MSRLEPFNRRMQTATDPLSATVEEHELTAYELLLRELPDTLLKRLEAAESWDKRLVLLEEHVALRESDAQRKRPSAAAAVKPPKPKLEPIPESDRPKSPVFESYYNLPGGRLKDPPLTFPALPYDEQPTDSPKPLLYQPRRCSAWSSIVTTPGTPEELRWYRTHSANPLKQLAHPDRATAPPSVSFPL